MKSKLTLKDSLKGEILNIDQMRQIFESGSRSGSEAQSACRATCQCPDIDRTFPVSIACMHDCSAEDNVGVGCIDGETVVTATCAGGYATQCYDFASGSGSVPGSGSAIGSG